jgi:hypothetical protein
MQSAILAVVLVFVVLFGAMTISVIAESGFDVISGLAIVVLALIGFGVIGALRNPPPPDA